MDIEKAIEILSQIKRESEGCLRLNLDEKTREIYENQLSACSLAIQALENQLKDRWIPVSDGKYIIEVKEGEIVSCQNLKI